MATTTQDDVAAAMTGKTNHRHFLVARFLDERGPRRRTDGKRLIHLFVKRRGINQSGTEYATCYPQDTSQC